MVVFHNLCDFDDPLLADVPHEPQLSHSCTSIFVTAMTCVSQDCGISILAISCQVCVSRTDILESCWCSVIALLTATVVLEKESCCVSIHLYAADLKHFVVMRLQKTHIFHRLCAQVRRRNLLMRNGSLSSSLPALPAVLSGKFCDIVEITNPTTMHVESASRRQPQEDFKTLSRE